MPYQPHAAAYTAFKDFYQEVLAKNGNVLVTIY